MKSYRSDSSSSCGSSEERAVIKINGISAEERVERFIFEVYSNKSNADCIQSICSQKHARKSFMKFLSGKSELHSEIPASAVAVFKEYVSKDEETGSLRFRIDQNIKQVDSTVLDKFLEHAEYCAWRAHEHGLTTSMAVTLSARQDPNTKGSFNGNLDFVTPFQEDTVLSVIPQQYLDHLSLCDSWMLHLLQSVKQLPLGFVCVEAKSKLIIYVNEYFEIKTGYSSSESIEKPLAFLCGTETEIRKISLMKLALRCKRRVAFNITLYRKDGTKFVVHLSFKTIKDQRGQPQFVIILLEEEMSAMENCGVAEEHFNLKLVALIPGTITVDSLEQDTTAIYTKEEKSQEL
jgi:PAS domain S-box-containing protein